MYLSRSLCPTHKQLRASPMHYNSRPSRSLRPGFKHKLFPVHSPLLGESWLFSFPPLNDMLKFSGFSCTMEVGLLACVPRLFLDATRNGRAASSRMRIQTTPCPQYPIHPLGINTYRTQVCVLVTRGGVPVHGWHPI